MSSMLLGSTIGHFRIVDQLGKGGMGEVFVGHDEKLDRRVALKSIRAERRFDAEAKTRFLREARILSQLKHPNICQIFDYVECADADFLVLELIDGRSLAEAMRKGLDAKLKFQIAEQIAGVLVAAHEQGVVHRDLKPDNVMLAEGDQVKVLDFGLSRSQQQEATLSLALARVEAAAPGATPLSGTEETGSVTTLGTIMGTLGYMSPEQARGELATPASDLYSFGLVVQELFTGQPPYEQGDRPPFDDERSYDDASQPPFCELCHAKGRVGLLRPHIVWFGELLDPRHFAEVETFIEGARTGRLVFLAAGTSGTVFPANTLVDRAAAAGAETWLVNAEPPDNASRFERFLRGRSGEILPALFGEPDSG